MNGIKELIKIAIQEDLGKLKDITSRGIFNQSSRATAKAVAKDKGILAGISIVREVFHHIDDSLSFHEIHHDGDFVSENEDLFIVKGSIISILEGERIALNFLCHLSGVATTVNQFVKAVDGTGVQILDTRKTIPGFRELEKKAVLLGGGLNHRMGLYDRILIKDNHIEGAGGIQNAVEIIRKEYGDSLFIEVETRTLKEVEDAIHCKVDQILLDNMSLEMLRKSVLLVNNKISLEASGNVGIYNVRSIAETGVDYISIGAMTLSSKAFDISLRIVNT